MVNRENVRPPANDCVTQGPLVGPFGALILAALTAFGAPIAAFLGYGRVEPGAWIVAPICCGGLLVMIVIALVGSIVETFTSATWTLAYRELTGLVAPPAEEPVAEPTAE